jgi:hypothetical protein
MKSPECKELYHKNKMKSGDVEKVIIKKSIPNKDDKPLKAVVPPENVSSEEFKTKTAKTKKKVMETI